LCGSRWVGSGRLRLPQSFHRRVPGVWASVLDGKREREVEAEAAGSYLKGTLTGPGSGR
jgi:hypothetical protein